MSEDLDKRKRSTPQIGSLIIGALLTLGSLPCVIAMIHDLIVGAENLQGAVIAGTFFSVLLVIGLGMVWYGGLAKPAGLPAEALEKSILRAAQEHGGRITISELAVATPHAMGDLERELGRLEVRDLARTHVSEGGQVVYVFPQFVTNKMNAIDPLDYDRSDVVLDGLDDEEEAEHPAVVTASSAQDGEP